MITKNKVVTLSYLLKNESGEELDRADAQQPFQYLHGNNQIVPGLEDALEGLNVGDKKQVTVTPEEGYGQVVPELRFDVARDRFPGDMEIAPGMQFSAELSGRRHVFTVTEIEGENIKVDGNHPLAGETLHFSVEVINVRDASNEEIEHGHAHDPNNPHSH